MAIWGKKKLFLFLVLLLCAGCIHHVASPSVPAKTAAPAHKYAKELVVTPGTAVKMDEPLETVDGGKRVSEAATRPTKTAVFIDELHGFGLVSTTGSLTLMKSSDGGETWQAISSLAHKTGFYGLSFLDNQTGWLLTGESDDRKLELRLTSDGGQTWEVIAQDLPGFDKLTGVSFFRFFDRQNGLIALQSTEDMVLLRTQDGGLTWSASSRIPLPQNNTGVLTFVSSNNGWFVGPGNKGEGAAVLFRMVDGETWEEAGKLPGQLSPQAVSFSNTQEGWLLLHSNAESEQAQWLLLRTADGGMTWSRHEFPRAVQHLDIDMQLIHNFTKTGWLLGVNGLWRSVNGGMNWSRLTP